MKAAKQCIAQTPTKRSFQNNPVSATKIIQSAVNYQKNREKLNKKTKTIPIIITTISTELDTKILTQPLRIM